MPLVYRMRLAMNKTVIRKIIKKQTNKLLLPLTAFYLVVSLGLIQFESFLSPIFSNTASSVTLVLSIIFAFIVFTCTCIIAFIENTLNEIERNREIEK